MHTVSFAPSMSDLDLAEHLGGITISALPLALSTEFWLLQILSSMSISS